MASKKTTGEPEFPEEIGVLEAATILGIGKNAMYTRVAAGHFPTRLKGRKLMIPKYLVVEERMTYKRAGE